MTIASQVTRIIAEQAVLNEADVLPDMTMADLGLDSLGLVEAFFAIEETFDVSIPFNANEPDKGAFDISTVGAVIAGVEKLVAARG